MPVATERTGVGRDRALDGLRGVAVLLVYLFHYGGGLKSSHSIVRAFGYFTEAGWVGVVLFFALSGFLITGSLWDSLGERHLLLNFYMRRALRILPLYYVIILIALGAAVARGVRFNELFPIALYAGFLQNFPVLVNTALQSPSQLPMFHLWSLAVEEQFYLLWPAVVLFSRNRRAALTCSLWIVGASELFRILTHLPMLRPEFAATFDPSLLTHCGTLAMGAALALAIRGPHWRQWERQAWVWFVGGLAIYLAVSFYCRSFFLTAYPQFTIGLFGVGLASTAVIPLVMRPGRVHSILGSAPLRYLGRVSYGFYVLHIFIEPLIDRLGARAAHAGSGQNYQLARLLIGFVLTLLLASISYFALELPFLELKRRFPMRSPLPPPERTAQARI
jgi:peptidoglycan/LPS O-acetylase OafA/YrhL